MEFQTYNIVNERPRTIRALARQALQGRWTEAFVLLLVVTAIEQVPVSLVNSIAREGSILGFIASIYSLLIAGPLAMGVAYYFIKLFRQRNGGLDDLKYGFGYAQKAIVLHLNIIIRVFLWALLFIVPGIIAGIRYSMANYILADDPSKSPQQCLFESSAMMRGNKMNYVVLMISFIGWLIVASIPSGIVESILVRPAQAFLNSTDPTQYFAALSQAANHPLALLASVPTLIVNAYMNTATACFYDLANGNLSVGGYDYAAAQGSVEDPFTGKDVTFTDVPTEVTHEDLPETFEDPELKAAEDKYTGDDNIYGE